MAGPDGFVTGRWPVTGELCGFGMTHFPGVLVPEEHWGGLLRNNARRGRIPQEVFEAVDHWPDAMRVEWAEDDGAAAAKPHWQRIRDASREIRRRLDAFAPDVVVVFGDDQYENFTMECIPSTCVYILEGVESQPLRSRVIKAFGAPGNRFGLPEGEPLRTTSSPALARDLAEHLIAQGHETAYSYRTSSELGLAHSFAYTQIYLDPHWAGFEYPVVPVHINCYGSQMLGTAAAIDQGRSWQVSPPSPSPARVFALGRELARFLLDRDGRAAIIGSSSWSHASLTPKNHRLYPDHEADARLLRSLRMGTWTQWDALELAALEDAGQHEVLNWVALAGAMTEAAAAVEVLDYADTYVFNSNKCFAAFV